MTDFENPYPALREMEAVPLFAELGYRFTGAGDGWAEITFTASDKTHNLYGIVHGGVWLVIADSAMGGALATLTDPDERIITAHSQDRNDRYWHRDNLGLFTDDRLRTSTGARLDYNVARPEEIAQALTRAVLAFGKRYDARRGVTASR